MKTRMLYVVLAGLAPAAGVWAQAVQQGPMEFRVTRHGADASHVRALERLGVKAQISQDGGLRFIDPARFLAAPTRDLGAGLADEDGSTRLIAVDFGALASQKLLDSGPAMGRVADALKAAGVEMTGARAFAFNSTVDLWQGNAQRRVLLDTTVSHGFTLGGLPLVGPGAKMRFALGAGGVLTGAHVTTRALAPGGPTRLLSSEELRKREVARFGASAKLQSQVVYYAPPMSVRAQRIVPHRLYSGNVSVGGRLVAIRPMLVPLVADAPAARIEVDRNASGVIAKVSVSGGRAPYQFSFSEPDARAQIAGAQATFTFTPSNRDNEAESLVSVVVTDADGLTDVVKARFQPTQAPVRPIARPLPGELMVQHEPDLLALLQAARFPGATVGLHAVGQSYVGNELGLTLPNVAGFANKARDERVPVAFHWRERMAFERDWKSPDFAGSANRWFDAVDLGLFSGHAGGGGWVLSSSFDDGWASTDEIRLGRDDNEWAVIAACGPLQEASDRQNRTAFEGLHLLCGYATNSFDSDREGSTFASLIWTRESFLWVTLRDYVSIRRAWIMTAIECQPAEERPGSPIRVGVMGVRRDVDGVSSWDDFFFGRGPLSPDIRSSAARSFWVVRTGT